jgi:hypothetical protein
MSHAERLERLIREFERVGVDPNTISAGLAVREDDALKALSALPDQAGPAAFLHELRSIVANPAIVIPGETSDPVRR